MRTKATKSPRFTLRHATPDDAGLVLDFMQKLGAYQQMADQITATEARLHRLLTDGQGEALFANDEGATVGFMFFNQTSSAFTGRSGLFIDGFFIEEAARGRGLGKIMMGYLARLAQDRGCEMLEWGCLDWNHPTIAFYRDLGAYSLDSMTIYRLAPDHLKACAEAFQGA